MQDYKSASRSIKIASAALLFAASAVLSTIARAETITFEAAGPAGSPPNGFTQATTGQGSPADWKLQEEQGAPSGKLVVGQLSTEGGERPVPPPCARSDQRGGRRLVREIQGDFG